MGRRFLILSAGMGAGHDAVAGELVRRLTDRGHRADTLDVLDLLPARSGAALRGFYAATIRYAPTVYEAIYQACFVPRATTRRRPVLSTSPVVSLAAGELRRALADGPPDAVVATFHLAAQVTGRLREAGALRSPSAVMVTDFAVHRQWLHRGNDVYVCPTPHSAQAVRRWTGRRAVAAGPLVSGAFRTPPSAVRTAPFTRSFAARAPGRVPVLISSGAWGVGPHLERTAAVVRDGGHLPVVMCGRSEVLRRRLGRLPGVVPLGWVHDVPALMASAGALVENAAGQTAVQALAAGLPVVNHRPIAGHGLDGARHMAAAGLSSYARTPDDLLRILAELTTDSPARRTRVAAGHAAFAADPTDTVLAVAGAPPRGADVPATG